MQDFKTNWKSLNDLVADQNKTSLKQVEALAQLDLQYKRDYRTRLDAVYQLLKGMQSEFAAYCAAANTLVAAANTANLISSKPIQDLGADTKKSIVQAHTQVDALIADAQTALNERTQKLAVADTDALRDAKADVAKAEAVYKAAQQAAQQRSKDVNDKVQKISKIQTDAQKALNNGKPADAFGLLTDLAAEIAAIPKITDEADFETLLNKVYSAWQDLEDKASKVRDAAMTFESDKDSLPELQKNYQTLLKSRSDDIANGGPNPAAAPQDSSAGAKANPRTANG